MLLDFDPYESTRRSAAPAGPTPDYDFADTFADMIYDASEDFEPDEDGVSDYLREHLSPQQPTQQTSTRIRPSAGPTGVTPTRLRAMPRKTWKDAFKNVAANPFKYVPIVNILPNMLETVRVFNASRAVRDGSATKEQEEFLNQTLRDRYADSTLAYKGFDGGFKSAVYAAEVGLGLKFVSGASRAALAKGANQAVAQAGGRALASKELLTRANTLNQAMLPVGKGAVNAVRGFPNALGQYAGAKLLPGARHGTKYAEAAEWLMKGGSMGQYARASQRLDALKYTDKLLRKGGGVLDDAAKAQISKQFGAETAARVIRQAGDATHASVLPNAIKAATTRAKKEALSSGLRGLYFEGPLRGAITRPHMVAQEMVERMTPQFALTEDERGQIHRILVDDGDGWGEALGRSLSSQVLSSAGEMSGNLIYYLGHLAGPHTSQLLKGAALQSTLERGASNKGLAAIKALALGTPSRPGAVQAMGWHGWLPNMAEESVIDVLRIATLDPRGQGIGGMPTWEELQVRALSFLINPSALGGYALDKRRETLYRSYRNVMHDIDTLRHNQSKGRPTPLKTTTTDNQGQEVITAFNPIVRSIHEVYKEHRAVKEHEDERGLSGIFHKVMDSLQFKTPHREIGAAVADTTKLNLEALFARMDVLKERDGSGQLLEQDELIMIAEGLATATARRGSPLKGVVGDTEQAELLAKHGKTRLPLYNPASATEIDADQYDETTQHIIRRNDTTGKLTVVPIDEVTNASLDDLKDLAFAFVTDPTSMTPEEMATWILATPTAIPALVRVNSGMGASTIDVTDAIQHAKVGTGDVDADTLWKAINPAHRQALRSQIAPEEANMENADAKTKKQVADIWNIATQLRAIFGGASLEFAAPTYAYGTKEDFAGYREVKFGENEKPAFKDNEGTEFFLRAINAQTVRTSTKTDANGNVVGVRIVMSPDAPRHAIFEELTHLAVALMPEKDRNEMLDSFSKEAAGYLQLALNRSNELEEADSGADGVLSAQDTAAINQALSMLVDSNGAIRHRNAEEFLVKLFKVHYAGFGGLQLDESGQVVNPAPTSNHIGEADAFLRNAGLVSALRPMMDQNPATDRVMRAVQLATVKSRAVESMMARMLPKDVEGVRWAPMAHLMEKTQNALIAQFEGIAKTTAELEEKLGKLAADTTMEEGEKQAKMEALKSQIDRQLAARNALLSKIGQESAIQAASMATAAREKSPAPIPRSTLEAIRARAALAPRLEHDAMKIVPSPVTADNLNASRKTQIAELLPEPATQKAVIDEYLAHPLDTDAQIAERLKANNVAVDETSLALALVALRAPVVDTAADAVRLGRTAQADALAKLEAMRPRAVNSPDKAIVKKANDIRSHRRKGPRSFVSVHNTTPAADLFAVEPDVTDTSAPLDPNAPVPTATGEDVPLAEAFTRGSVVDHVFRAVLEGTPLDLTAEIADVAGDNGLPLEITEGWEDAIRAWAANYVIPLRNALEEAGYAFVAEDDVKIPFQTTRKHKLSAARENTSVKGQGTPDLILVAPDGTVMPIDLKTSSRDFVNPDGSYSDHFLTENTRRRPLVLKERGNRAITHRASKHDDYLLQDGTYAVGLSQQGLNVAGPALLGMLTENTIDGLAITPMNNTGFVPLDSGGETFDNLLRNVMQLDMSNYAVPKPEPTTVPVDQMEGTLPGRPKTPETPAKPTKKPTTERRGKRLADRLKQGRSSDDGKSNTYSMETVQRSAYRSPADFANNVIPQLAAVHDEPRLRDLYVDYLKSFLDDPVTSPRELLALADTIERDVIADYRRRLREQVPLPKYARRNVERNPAGQAAMDKERAAVKLISSAVRRMREEAIGQDRRVGMSLRAVVGDNLHAYANRRVDNFDAIVEEFAEVVHADRSDTAKALYEKYHMDMSDPENPKITSYTGLVDLATYMRETARESFELAETPGISAEEKAEYIEEATLILESYGAVMEIAREGITEKSKLREAEGEQGSTSEESGFLAEALSRITDELMEDLGNGRDSDTGFGSEAFMDSLDALPAVRALKNKITDIIKTKALHISSLSSADVEAALIQMLHPRPQADGSLSAAGVPLYEAVRSRAAFRDWVREDTREGIGEAFRAPVGELQFPSYLRSLLEPALRLAVLEAGKVARGPRASVSRAYQFKESAEARVKALQKYYGDDISAEKDIVEIKVEGEVVGYQVREPRFGYNEVKAMVLASDRVVIPAEQGQIITTPVEGGGRPDMSINLRPLNSSSMQRGIRNSLMQTYGVDLENLVGLLSQLRTDVLGSRPADAIDGNGVTRLQFLQRLLGLAKEDGSSALLDTLAKNELGRRILDAFAPALGKGGRLALLRTAVDERGQLIWGEKKTVVALPSATEDAAGITFSLSDVRHRLDIDLNSLGAQLSERAFLGIRDVTFDDVSGAKAYRTAYANFMSAELGIAAQDLLDDDNFARIYKDVTADGETRLAVTVYGAGVLGMPSIGAMASGAKVNILTADAFRSLSREIESNLLRQDMLADIADVLYDTGEASAIGTLESNYRNADGNMVSALYGTSDVMEGLTRLTTLFKKQFPVAAQYIELVKLDGMSIQTAGRRPYGKTAGGLTAADIAYLQHIGYAKEQVIDGQSFYLHLLGQFSDKAHVYAIRLPKYSTTEGKVTDTKEAYRMLVEEGTLVLPHGQQIPIDIGNNQTLAQLLAAEGRPSSEAIMSAEAFNANLDERSDFQDISLYTPDNSNKGKFANLAFYNSLFLMASIGGLSDHKSVEDLNKRSTATPGTRMHLEEARDRMGVDEHGNLRRTDHLNYMVLPEYTPRTQAERDLFKSIAGLDPAEVEMLNGMVFFIDELNNEFLADDGETPVGGHFREAYGDILARIDEYGDGFDTMKNLYSSTRDLKRRLVKGNWFNLGMVERNKELFKGSVWEKIYNYVNELNEQVLAGHNGNKARAFAEMVHVFTMPSAGKLSGVAIADKAAARTGELSDAFRRKTNMTQEDAAAEGYHLKADYDNANIEPMYFESLRMVQDLRQPTSIRPRTLSVQAQSNFSAMMPGFLDSAAGAFQDRMNVAVAGLRGLFSEDNETRLAVLNEVTGDGKSDPVLYDLLRQGVVKPTDPIVQNWLAPMAQSYLQNNGTRIQGMRSHYQEMGGADLNLRPRALVTRNPETGKWEESETGEYVRLPEVYISASDAERKLLRGEERIKLSTLVDTFWHENVEGHAFDRDSYEDFQKLMSLAIEMGTDLSDLSQERKRSYHDLYIPDANGMLTDRIDWAAIELDGNDVIIAGSRGQFTRIPSNLEMHVEARVKGFIESDVAVILTPAAMTQIIGSDFDGDVLFAAWGFGKDGTYDFNDPAARMLQSQASAAMDPANHGVYTRSLNVLMDRLKDLAKELQPEDKSGKRAWNHPDNFIDARNRRNLSQSLRSIMSNIYATFANLRNEGLSIAQLSQDRNALTGQPRNYHTFRLGSDTAALDADSNIQVAIGGRMNDPDQVMLHGLEGLQNMGFDAMNLGLLGPEAFGLTEQTSNLFSLLMATDPALYGETAYTVDQLMDRIRSVSKLMRTPIMQRFNELARKQSGLIGNKLEGAINYEAYKADQYADAKALTERGSPAYGAAIQGLIDAHDKRNVAEIQNLTQLLNLTLDSMLLTQHLYPTVKMAPVKLGDYVTKARAYNEMVRLARTVPQEADIVSKLNLKKTDGVDKTRPYMEMSRYFDMENTAPGFGDGMFSVAEGPAPRGLVKIAYQALKGAYDGWLSEGVAKHPGVSVLLEALSTGQLTSRLDAAVAADGTISEALIELLPIRGKPGQLNYPFRPDQLGLAKPKAVTDAVELIFRRLALNGLNKRFGLVEDAIKRFAPNKDGGLSLDQAMSSAMAEHIAAGEWLWERRMAMLRGGLTEDGGVSESLLSYLDMFDLELGGARYTGYVGADREEQYRQHPNWLEQNRADAMHALDLNVSAKLDGVDTSTPKGLEAFEKALAEIKDDFMWNWVSNEKGTHDSANTLFRLRMSEEATHILNSDDQTALLEIRHKAEVFNMHRSGDLAGQALPVFIRQALLSTVSSSGLSLSQTSGRSVLALMPNDALLALSESLESELTLLDQMVAAPQAQPDAVAEAAPKHKFAAVSMALNMTNQKPGATELARLIAHLDHDAAYYGQGTYALSQLAEQERGMREELKEDFNRRRHGMMRQDPKEAFKQGGRYSATRAAAAFHHEIFQASQAHENAKMATDSMILYSLENVMPFADPNPTGGAAMFGKLTQNDRANKRLAAKAISFAEKIMAMTGELGVRRPVVQYDKDTKTWFVHDPEQRSADSPYGEIYQKDIKSESAALRIAARLKSANRKVRKGARGSRRTQKLWGRRVGYAVMQAIENEKTLQDLMVPNAKEEITHRLWNGKIMPDASGMKNPMDNGMYALQYERLTDKDGVERDATIQDVLLYLGEGNQEAGRQELVDIIKTTRSAFDELLNEVNTFMVDVADRQQYIKPRQNYVYHAFLMRNNADLNRALAADYTAIIGERTPRAAGRSVLRYEDAAILKGLEAIDYNPAFLLKQWAADTMKSAVAQRGLAEGLLVKHANGRPIWIGEFATRGTREAFVERLRSQRLSDAEILERLRYETGIPEGIIWQAAFDLRDAVNEYRLSRSKGHGLTDTAGGHLEETRASMAADARKAYNDLVAEVRDDLAGMGYNQFDKVKSRFSAMNGWYTLDYPDQMGQNNLSPRDRSARNALSVLENHRFTNDFVTVAASVNNFFKWAQLGLSGFHAFSLLESAIAAGGLTEQTAGFLVPWRWGSGDSSLIPFATRHRQLRNYMAQARQDAEFGGKWIGKGMSLDFAEAPDYFSNKIIWGFEHFAKEGLGSTSWTKWNIGAISRGIAGYGKWMDKMLWREWMPSMKLFTAESLRNRYHEAFQDAYGRDLSVSENDKLMEDISHYMNKAFGGLEWTQFHWATPKIRQLMQLMFFAPDWTLSALTVAGAGSSPFLGSMIGERKNEYAANQQATVYWPTMIALVQTALPAIMQVAIKGSLGRDDEEMSWLPWDNEFGRDGIGGIGAHIDVTPIAKALGWPGDLSGKRRMYIRYAKQSTEIWEGWATDWVGTALGKTSALTKFAVEQLTSHSVSGFPMDFKGRGVAGIFTGQREGWRGGRLAHAGTKILPFMITGNFIHGRPSVPVAQTSLGTSFYAASREYARVLASYAADQNARELARNPKARIAIDALGREILAGAERNGLDPKAVRQSAVAAVRSNLYGDLFRAMNRGDQKAMDDAAARLIRMEGSMSQAIAAMKTRKRGYGGTITREDYAAIREAFRRR